jgi:hypothetical protein
MLGGLAWIVFASTTERQSRLRYFFMYKLLVVSLRIQAPSLGFMMEGLVLRESDYFGRGKK